MIHPTDNLPLISVVIPTYNYAAFLPRAIDSVLQQTYSNYEVIVIDDGSTDDTVQVVPCSDRVLYFYQQNKGLAAARNAGIEKASGQYLLFLDADDWLEPAALETNYAVLKDKPETAFVSGSHRFLKATTNQLYTVTVSVASEHYSRLLESNYIGMHATVLFQRWVFDALRYDESLPSCEDYDLYLRIARHHPVLHHEPVIATYYFHPSGLSHNYEAMRDSIRAVMQKQAPYIRSAGERKAYEAGLQQWKVYDEMLHTAEACDKVEAVS